MRINMGGSGSSGDTQTYDAEELITAANAHAKHYQTLRAQFNTLRTAFQQISGLGSNLQGHGADAIKAFYSAQVNVVDAWLRLIDEKIAYFQGVAGTINDKNLGGDTQVHVPFLNEDLSMGYARSKEMVREQRDDISKILSSISDLVPINVFSNHDVDQALDAADKKRAQTALDIQDLDQSLTNEYRQIAENLPHIQALYGELIHATRQGADVQPMHFNATAYHDSKIYQVQDDMRKQTQTYLESKKQQEQARHVSKKETQPVNPLLANATKAVIIDQEIKYGIRAGAKDAVKDTVLGIWDAATNPVETFKGTWYSATHPIQTFTIIKNALVQSFDKDIVHGNAYTRSRWIVYAFTTLAAAFVGTKGVDKLGKVAKAGKIGEAASKARMVTKTALAKHADSVNNKFNRWSTPLFPRTQFADDPIPYNVIDTKGLRNKVQQLPDRNDRLTNQIDYVRDLIQQASTNKRTSTSLNSIDSQATSVEKFNESIKGSDQTTISTEMRNKILESQRKAPTKNKIIGGHSPNINNFNPNYAVEVIAINFDGTKKVKFVTQFDDGDLSKIKTSTVFPDSWTDDTIIKSIEIVGNTSPIGVRASDGATLHRDIVNGVQIEVIKIGDNVTSGYPTGRVNTGLLPNFLAP